MPNSYQNFKISFSHEQHLHNLTGKLRHAQNILINTRDTFKMIREHGDAIDCWQSALSVEDSSFHRDLDNLSREVEGYIGTSRKLLRMSDDLKSMVRDTHA